MSPIQIDDLPTAKPARPKKSLWYWVFPLVALSLVTVLCIQEWQKRGVAITIYFDRGYGLQKGDSVRFRGIDIGFVQDVSLSESLSKVKVKTILSKQAVSLAREGALFWIVRPTMGFEGISGLETLVGSNYISVLPGKGSQKSQFIGLEEPPVVEGKKPGDLDIIIEASDANDIMLGSSLYYRSISIGKVVSKKLVKDGSSVIFRVRVPREFSYFIRKNSQFWKATPFQVEMGLMKGLRFDLKSLQTFFGGGIVVATPQSPGEEVSNEYKFKVQKSPVSGWEKWKPVLLPGSPLIPADQNIPSMHYGSIIAKKSNWWSFSFESSSWFLPYNEGVITLARSLPPYDNNLDLSQFELHLQGDVYTFRGKPENISKDMIYIHLENSKFKKTLAKNKIEKGKVPVDSILWYGQGQESRWLGANRFISENGSYIVDRDLHLDRKYNGMPIYDSKSFKLVGFLVLKDDLWYWQALN